MSVVCSFFGHRNADNRISTELYYEIERHIAKNNADTFYVGGYGNFDSIASGILHEMKKRYPHIEVYHVLAYIPVNAGKEININQHPTLFPEGLELVPKKFAIIHRNRWIVNESDYIIGYVLTNCGGAYEALRYAEQRRKTIVNLDCRR